MQTVTSAVEQREALISDWEALYREHASELQRYLVKLTGEPEEAIELMQDAFIRAMNADIHDVRAVRSWLFRTATNMAVSRVRRRRLIAFLPFGGNEVALDAGFDEEAYHVRTALASIPPDQAATLLLHYQSGFSRSEIAELQELSEDGVKSRLSRGRKNFVAAYRRLQRGLKR